MSAKPFPSLAIQSKLSEASAILSAKCKLGKVFVSAFQDLKSFAKWAPGISWETEIWVADNPTHMIHYNGDRFYGPRKS